jgi:alkylation response protein AidB-like acyl-CoA dehydrogenase
VDFSLSPEQELLRETARAVLAAHCTPALVRAHLADPSQADGLWQHLREFTGLATGPVVDLCLFLEETGAALAPGPFFSTTALFAPVVAAAGDDALLARIADGEVTGTVTLRAPVATPAVEGDRVDLIAIVDAEPSVRIVEQPQVAVDVLPPFDLSRTVAEVAEPSSRNGAVRPVTQAALDTAIARATVATAAELIGTARWTLDTTLEYVKVREQFDRPIGSFQALQHRLADMKLLFERAWSAVYFAAMTVDADDPERDRAVHVAKASAGDAARHIAKESIQMHGGIGFTWEHDLHLYIRRAFASEQLLGTSDWHRDRLADLVL